MASKQVTDRQKAAGAVVVTVETYGDRLRTGIAATLVNSGGGAEAAAAATALARAAGSALSGSTAALVSTDEAHAAELLDDAGLRLGRDTAAAALREHLVGLRDGLVGLYGPTVPAAAGFAGPTPEDPVVLARVGREVAAGLRKKNVLPTPRYKKATIDPLEEAATLEALADRLSTAIDAVVEDVRQNQVTKTARDAAMTAHDGTFSRTAKLLSALFAFAGEPELADRVRPSARTPGRLASGEGEVMEADVPEVVAEVPATEGSASPAQ